MRASQFLFEYNRDITAKQVGDHLLMALRSDQGSSQNDALDTIGYQLAQEVRTIEDLKKYPEAARNEWISQILTAIEQRDPTPTNKYTPWLARMYAKAGGGLRIEDINRMNLIGLYDLAKLKKKLKPEHKDINSFKWYVDFEDTAESEYNYFRELTDDQVEEGSATKLFDNKDVLVLTPNDEAAACKYGKGTRWCTAATKGYNYFDSYNAKGPLYILIPKNPTHPGEKYQFHFGTNSYMNEHDNPVRPNEIVEERFPGLLDFFAKKEPGIQYSTQFIFFDKKGLFDLVKEQIINIIKGKPNKDKYSDKEYLKFLEYEGFTDDEGEIDWERVEDTEEYSYDNFADGYDDAIEFVEKKFNSNRTWSNQAYDDDEIKDIRFLPDVMARDLYWLIYDSRYDTTISNETYEILRDIVNEVGDKRLLKTSAGKWRITN